MLCCPWPPTVARLQQVISIICRTLQHFDEDHRIPAFGFGDYETKDSAVFPFWPDGRECDGLEEVLTRCGPGLCCVVNMEAQICWSQWR